MSNAIKTLRRVLVVSGLLLATACAGEHASEVVTLVDASADARAPGWHEQSMDVAGVQRWYRYFVPSNAPANPQVVVLLHGGTLSMRELFESRVGGGRGWLKLAGKQGFILLVPNGTNPDTGDTRGDDQIWNDLRAEGSERQSHNDDVAFIGQLLDWAAATLDIDVSRVYLTGASNGGMMTYRLLVESPDRFAAAAAFIATLPADIERIKQPARPVPLMIANGTKDPIIKWEGGKALGGLNQSSTPATLAWWIKANHADPGGAKTEELPDTDPKDQCRISRTDYPAQAGGAPVLFYAVEGGSHAMPSREHRFREGPIIQATMGLPRDVEGAEIAWDFMKSFTVAPAAP